MPNLEIMLFHRHLFIFFLRCCVPAALLYPGGLHCQVTVYEHANFGGHSQTLKTGRYTAQGLRGFNDLISSVKVAEGYRAVVYTDGNGFGGYGKQRVLETDYADLVSVGVNDVISYIEVSALKDSVVASVFEDWHFQGRRRDLRAGDIVFYSSEDMNDQISSIKIQPGFALIAWDIAEEDAVSVFKGTGAFIYLEYDVTDLTTALSMNDRISFITVTAIPKPFANGGCRGPAFDFLAPHFNDKWVPGNEIVLNFTVVNSMANVTGFIHQIKMPLNNLLVANDSTLRGSGRMTFSSNMMPAGDKVGHFNPHQSVLYEFSINVCTNRLKYIVPDWNNMQAEANLTSRSGLLYGIGYVDMNVFTFVSCGPPP